MITRCSRGVLRAAAVFCVVAAACHGTLAAADAQASLYRIFLRDGGTLISYGEYAKVAGRVVFSIPVSDVADANLQLVSIAETTVDWDRTERYADAVRARRYAETRGEEDFALLTGRVAEALYIVASTKDPAQRLALADEARRKLSQWPAQNYGYRAADVAQLASMLDEVVSELRLAAGKTSFDLSLVATTLPPPPVDLLPAPDPRQVAEQALTAARLTPEPAERTSLLRAITSSLKESAAAGGWAADLYARAGVDLATEARVDKAYLALAETLTSAAKARTARADVRGLQAIIQRALTGDDRLGRQRPQEMASLLAFLDTQLEEARRLRLAQDAWAMRRAAFAEYRKQVSRVLGDLRPVRASLEDIKQLAGPAPDVLSRLEQRVSDGMRDLALLSAPAELDAAHSLLKAALQTAYHAAATRRAAISSRDMKVAWDASSAAAGALLLLDQAFVELDRLTAPSQR